MSVFQFCAAKFKHKHIIGPDETIAKNLLKLRASFKANADFTVTPSFLKLLAKGQTNTRLTRLPLGGFTHSDIVAPLPR